MSNQEQIDYWNGEAGRRWAAYDERMERLLRPITDALLAHAAVAAGSRALDVGCGGGSQSLMLAQQLGSDGYVLGVDISEPMLQVARGKPRQAAAGRAPVEFLHADAAEHSFEAGSFDLLFSRFGVMFFDDPVAAFSNLRQALHADARLAFCCWQSLQDNDWIWLALQAALQHLPPPEAPDPHAPGPFALADPERLQAILSASGFSAIRLQPFATEMTFGDAGSLQENVSELVKIGPIGRLLEDLDAATTQSVMTSIEGALEPYYTGEALIMPAAAWFVTAAAA